MRAVLRIVSSVIAVVVMCLCSVPLNTPEVYAQTSDNAVQISAKQVVQADAPAKTVRIKKNKVISNDLVIPEGTTYYVKEGGALYINKGVEVVLEGKLRVADGGAVYIKGALDCRDGSLVNINGKIKLMSVGTIKLGGKMNVYADGVVKGKGTLEVLNAFSDIYCKGTVKAKIKAPKPIVKDGLTYVGGILLVNKQYKLPKTYGSGIDRKAYSAYLNMKEASGYDMTIVSGFRSYEKQKSTFEYWCSIDGFELASTYSAQPGRSEHQTGLAMDITSLESSYGKTAEGKWLAKNCYKYGFIIRYPKGKEDITGYMYEPWHVRYLGVSTAKLVYDSGLCLEEFLGVA